MQTAILAFALGAALVQCWTRLPHSVEWLVIVAALLILKLLRLRLCWFLLLGMAWASVYAQWRLHDRLVDALQARDVAVRGFIASLPRTEGQRSSFDFEVLDAPVGVPNKLRLNWYTPASPIKAGQSWEFTVRLKKPHALSNPGGFDYEAWLFANRIGATGYVRPKPEAKPLEPGFQIKRYLAQLRQHVSDRLNATMPESEWLGVVKALAMGNQDQISKTQWDLFRKTGTVHLMVISGAHIGLVAGLVFMSFRRLWAWTGLLQMSPHGVAAIVAWVAACCYTALAGFSIPAERALLMLTVAFAAILWQRNTSALQVLQLALFVVVLFDPLAVLAVGFWLSFAAVALLMYISIGRLGRGRSWFGVVKVHVAMALGLAPLLIVFFQQVSLIAPLANWVAVPVIGLLITPLALLAACVALISQFLAAKLLWPVEQVMHWLGFLLQQMAALPLAVVSCPSPNGYALLFAILGILLFLAPKGMPGRYSAPFFLLPLLFGHIEKPRFGDVWITTLDVGQGLAIVVQTQNHELIYDAGAKYSEEFDMGEAVVLPFLRYNDIDHIDRLVISHGENDHAGGAASILAGVEVDGVYSSAEEWAKLANGRYCVAGQKWRWDGVNFEMLSPGAQAFASQNNNSCVLKITSSKQSVLLTGDIEREAERWLVDRYGAELDSSVLVAPHHGSKTSSYGFFLDRVDPELILISAGFMNRFGFPHQRVLQRYRNRAIPYLTTADHGAITVKLVGEARYVSSWRGKQKRYWMKDDP